MHASPRFPSALWAALVALTVLGSAPAPAAARPARIAVSVTASSARHGATAGKAIDGRRSTSWRSARRGPSWLRVTLKRAVPLASIRLFGTGPGVSLRIEVSRDGRRFTTAATTRLLPRRARSVNLRGAVVRRLLLRSARPAGVAELELIAARPASSGRPGPPGPAPGRAATSTTAGGAPLTGPTDPTGPAPDPTPVGGRFAGVVRDPIDPKFLSCLPFGKRSHWIQPWRAYLDTWPAARLKRAVGINFNTTPAEAPSTARLLAASGFARARIEIGWGEISYDDPDRLRNEQDWMTKLQALRDNGIRPLFLLNANDGRPAPAKDLSLRLTLPAGAGDRTVQLDADSAAQVRPGYTGFNYYKSAEYLITSVSPTGLATLARPLPVSVAAGTYPATTLEYKPFSPLTGPDGSPNPDGEATMAGWLRYVQTITDVGRRVFGAGGFDLEVWNELNFGSDFLDINRYYEPDLYGTRISNDTILRRTVSWVKDPAHDLGGVRIGNGFASQGPWEGGDSGPVGLDAIDRHFYPRYLRFPFDTVNNQLKDADCNTAAWDYNPTYTTFFPEFWLTGIATETMVRDLAPAVEEIRNLDGGVDHHGRDVAPAGGTPPAVWMTEFGVDTGWAKGQPGASITADDEQYLRAKSALRALTSFVNKGVTQLDFYAAAGAEWGLVDPRFYAAIAATGRYPGDDAGGPTTSAVRRLVGALGDARITVPRRLTLASIADYAGRSQFTGLNDSRYPTLYDRDVLAFLPFQASDHRFVVPVYVMTRDMSKVYRPDLGGDPRRFDLPAERYQLTIGGTRSGTATVHALDPLTGQSVPVDVVRRDPSGWLSVEMPVTDSPRLLVIDD